MKQKNKTRKLWLRLGIELCADEQQIERVINEDHGVLRQLLSDGAFTATGDAYIPDCSIDDYNNEYGTEHPLREVNFCL